MQVRAAALPAYCKLALSPSHTHTRPPPQTAMDSLEASVADADESIADLSTAVANAPKESDFKRASSSTPDANLPPPRHHVLTHTSPLCVFQARTSSTRPTCKTPRVTTGSAWAPSRRRTCCTSTLPTLAAAAASACPTPLSPATACRTRVRVPGYLARFLRALGRARFTTVSPFSHSLPSGNGGAGRHVRERRRAQLCPRVQGRWTAKAP